MGAISSRPQLAPMQRGPARTPGEDSDDDDVISPSMLFSTSKRVLLSSAINCIVNSISTDPSILEAMPNNETLKVFQEEQYHQNKQQNDTLKPYLDPFTKTLLDGSAWHVTEFVLMMLHRGYFDVSEFIISVIYLMRFTKTTGITLHVSAW